MLAGYDRDQARRPRNDGRRRRGPADHYADRTREHSTPVIIHILHNISFHLTNIVLYYTTFFSNYQNFWPSPLPCTSLPSFLPCLTLPSPAPYCMYYYMRNHFRTNTEQRGSGGVVDIRGGSRILTGVGRLPYRGGML